MNHYQQRRAFQQRNHSPEYSWVLMMDFIMHGDNLITVVTKQEIKDKFSADNPAAYLWKALKRINVIAVQNERLHKTRLPNWNGLPQLLLTHIHIRLHIESTDENISYESASPHPICFLDVHRYVITYP
ncbi:MAG: hypothetical protein WBF33_14485 [Candidatus Nitrosopolaris sp.]|jgi:hypothetical protein